MMRRIGAAVVILANLIESTFDSGCLFFLCEKLKFPKIWNSVLDAPDDIMGTPECLDRPA